MGRWGKLSLEAGKRFGKTLEIVDLQKGYIEEAGFEDVVEHRFKLPVGPWSSDPKLKELGRWNVLNWQEGMEGWTMALFTRVLGVCQTIASALLRMLCPRGPSFCLAGDCLRLLSGQVWNKSPGEVKSY